MAGGGIQGAGGVFEQFAIWGILMQVAAAILAPVVQSVQQQMYQALQITPLPPAQLADLVLKSYVDEPTAAVEAAKAGIDPARFHQMVDDAGEPPGLQMLLEAFRRGFISWDSDNAEGVSAVRGIQQSRLRDQWATMVQQLAVQVIPVGDAVSAVVKGQIPHALGTQIAYWNGISGDDFTVLVNTAGNPPGPMELIELARRGLIPIEGTGPQVLSLQQGIYEGMTKDKWYPAMRELMVYIPPPRTITALERSGSLTPAQAQKFYQDAGLDPALAAVYSHNASTSKVAKAHVLAEGTVLHLYDAAIIPAAEATTLLGTLGYTAQESAWVLAWNDLHRELAALEKAITKVSTLYIARKIGQTTAVKLLGDLGVPGSQQAQLLQDWTLERDASVKVLTAAEIGDAVKYQIITEDEGITALMALGYDDFDAWVRLSLSQNTALPNRPPQPSDITGQKP